MLLTQTARAAPAPRCYLVLPDVDPKCSEPRSLQFHRHYCRALDRLCMELICSSESGSHGGGSDKLLLSLFSSYTVYQEYFTDKFSEVLNLAPSIVFFGSRSNKGPRSAADNEQTRFVYVDTENMGVHHSKYIILFTEKFLHVIVSTSNLVPQTCIDMCWTQSFPRLAHSTSAPACLKGADSNSTRNDFGLILENFIEMVKICCSNKLLLNIRYLYTFSVFYYRIAISTRSRIRCSCVDRLYRQLCKPGQPYYQ